MKAPADFCRWMTGHIANDKNFGRAVFRYHPGPTHTRRKAAS
jgi:hypothetical protein